MAQQNLVLGASDNDGNGEGLRDTFLKIEGNTTELYTRTTGWEEYEDDTHTSGSPQVINAGVTADLTNDGVTATRTSQSPLTSGSFFDISTAELTPENEGDFYVVDFMFHIKNSVQSGVLDIYVDIGGIGERFLQSVICPKASNTETGANVSFSFFVSSQFATNGGVVKARGVIGNSSIYDKQFRICRVHKAF